MMARCIPILPLAAAMLSVVACSGEPEEPLVKAPPVATASVIALDIEESIEVTGELHARHHAVVAAEVVGRVSAVLREEGTPVEAGDAVLELDPQRRRLELDEARARVAQAEAAAARERRNVDRMVKLSASKAVSKKGLDDARTALAEAGANLAAARARRGVAEQALADATVTAPFAGVVGERRVSVGEFVQVGTPLLEFVSLDPIEVVFHLAEVDSGRVAVGQQLSVEVAPYPGESFAATVDVVYPTIDPRSRTLRVKALLQNAEGKLRPGLFARADLGISVRDGVAMVPEESVLQRADGSVVFTVGSDNHVKRRRVEIGAIRDGLVEVRSGLEVGETVITRGQVGLIDGSLVDPVASDDEASLAGSLDDAHASTP